MVMLKKFFGSVNSFFALDIGTTAVRVIELTETPSGWKYERYGFVPLDPNLATDQDTLSKSIEKAINEAGIKSKNVVISLPEKIANIKIADIKKEPNKKLSKTIEAQIKRLESRQGEQNYEYITLGKSENDKTKVLIATASKAFVDERVELLGELGLNVVAAEPEVSALVRSVVIDDEPQLIINVKDFSMDFVISNQKIPYLNRTTPFGAGLFVGMLQQNLKLDTATAQKYVADYGLNPEIMNGQIVVALNTAIAQFMSEIFSLIGSFERKYHGQKIKKIILAGYGLVIPHFLETVRNQTGMETISVDLWQDITISDKLKSELNAVSPHFALAIGLAKRKDGD